MNCCIPLLVWEEEEGQPLLSTQESIQQLEDMHEALSMRCRSIWYRCEEYKIRAKRHKIEDNRIECVSQLRSRHQLLVHYELYVKMRNRVDETLQSIEQAQVVAGVAVQMAAAKATIDAILKSANVDKILALMDDLDDQGNQIREITGILGRDAGGGNVDFDEEAALEGLDQDTELPNLPVRLPMQQQQQQQIRISNEA